MQLAEFLQRYCTERDLSPTWKEQLDIAVRQFVTYCRKPLEELSAEDINGWAAILAEQVEPRTVKGKVGAVRTLLVAAGLDTRKIKRVKVPPCVPRAFSMAEIGRLLEAAAKQCGWFPWGLKRADYWLAIIHAAWDTALRAGDLLDLRADDLREHRGSYLVYRTQKKTGRVILCRLREETHQSLKRLLTQGESRAVVFAWGFRTAAFFGEFKKLAAAAGVHGTLKYLRRARATLEYQRGGPAAAARVLGHADGTGQLAWKNYIDRSQLGDDLPLPPPLPYR